ncbi:MAG: glycosyl hydrolase, partial [Planctomycetes bacterium]|nr:glycosyl hydrolase [Planctomycetota bacterium]
MSATRDGAPAREPARAPDRVLERDIGAVLVPEVRVPGTIASRDAVRPSNDYLRRFPPAGVIVFGRTPQGAGDPTALLAAVRATLAEAGEPRCFAACDLEQGAGLHFADATRLPPALALAAHDEVGHAARSAGALTALEARERGIELVLAPVVDVNTRRSNPIIAVRSFGAEPERAARHATAFLEGLHAGGAGGSAKHFPGHGDTEQDSHRELALVARSRAELERIELAPFRSAIAAGVDTVMVSHLDVPALTGEPGLAATLSARAIDVLRRELGFGGVVLSDALNMHALHGVERIHARALAAGCDGLLCPADPQLAAEELLDAVETGRLPRARLAEAAARMRALRAALEARRAT